VDIRTILRRLGDIAQMSGPLFFQAKTGGRDRIIRTAGTWDLSWAGRAKEAQLSIG